MNTSPDYSAYRIADPVHGAVGLSELEWAVVNTPVFQRLRRVKHLGLVSLVYPSADFSRFTHCIGTCHVVGRVLTGPRMRSAGLKPRDVQDHRLAGLLHDVGHYPLSHTLDHVARTLYDGGLKHEAVGCELVEHPGAGLSTLLGAARARRIVALLETQASPGRRSFPRLISSDLDADRIDYLLRTALLAGLPYGHVDIEYLIQHIAATDDGQLYVESKALRAVDHLLLCRYFDRQQVAYNPEVVALECLLDDLVRELCHSRALNLSPGFVRDMIDRGTWRDFDDETVVAAIRALARAEMGLPSEKAHALLNRRRPACVGDVELFGDRANAGQFALHANTVRRDLIPRWASATDTEIERWYVWVPKELGITNAGRVHQPGAAGGPDPAEEDLMQVRDPKTGRVTAVVNVERSLTHLLCDRLLCSLRVYLLLPQRTACMSTDDIRSMVMADIGHLR